VNIRRPQTAGYSIARVPILAMSTKKSMLFMYELQKIFLTLSKWFWWNFGAGQSSTFSTLFHERRDKPISLAARSYTFESLVF